MTMTMTVPIQNIRDLTQVRALVTKHNQNASQIIDFHDVYDATFLAMLAEAKQTFANDIFCIIKKLFPEKEYDLFLSAMANKLREAPPNYCCYILHYNSRHWYLYLVKKKEDGSLFILSFDSINFRISCDFEDTLTKFVNKFLLVSLLDVLGINFKSGIQNDGSSCGLMVLDFLKRVNALFSNDPLLFQAIDRIKSNLYLQKLLKIIVLRDTQEYEQLKLLPSLICDYRKSSKKPTKKFPDISSVWNGYRNLFNRIKTIKWLEKTRTFLEQKITPEKWEQIIDEFTLQLSLLQKTEFNIFQQLLELIRGGNYQEKDKIDFSNLLKSFLGKKSPPMIYAYAISLASKKDKFDLTGFNLGGTDLGGIVLRGANLENTNLSNTNLSGADLSNTNLSGANLSNANLSGADLSNTNLSGANLIGADLNNTNLSGANLSGAILSIEVFKSIKKIRENFKGVILTGNFIKADLSEIYLEDANLRGADLRGADLNSSYLVGANLSELDLSGANLYKTNLMGANLSNSNLSGANLKGAFFDNKTNLSGANLSGADLSGADLSNADLSNANLSNANLSGADLSGAYLSKESTSFLTDEQKQSVIVIPKEDVCSSQEGAASSSSKFYSNTSDSIVTKMLFFPDAKQQQQHQGENLVTAATFDGSAAKL